MNTSHVVQYRHKGRWLNYYLMADSIEDAERRARAWGIYGTGFELVEVIDG